MTNKCVLPFINQDYQFNSPCCLLQGFEAERDTEQLLEDHRNNRRSKFCRSCWKTEDSGLTSKRHQYNKLYENYLLLNKRMVKIAVIPVGNVCNLYCVTCVPESSTSWIKKYNQMYPSMNIRNHKIITEIKPSDVDNIDELEHIEFIGGETLKSISLWQYLKGLDKNTKFSLQTNGTVELTLKQIELLNSFKTFNICFSLDGYDKIFEYIRQPGKWEQVQQNVKTYIKQFGLNKLSVYVTVSNLNIFYIDKIMLNLFKLISSRIELNLVHTPKELAYNNLSENVGKIVEKNNPVFFKKNNIEWLGSSSSIKLMLDNLKKQDKFSKLKLEEHLPELFALIKEKAPT